MEKKKRNISPPQAPNLIREIKKRLKLTQTQLAIVLNITQPAVSDYELGKVDRERQQIRFKA